MPWRRCSQVGLAAVTLACGATELPISIDVDPGDLVVYAIVDDQAEIQDLELVIAEADGPTIREAEALDWLMSWRLRPTDLVDIVGQPLSVEQRKGLQVRSVDSPRTSAGACGRCLVPRGQGPQVILEGASCTLPSVLEARAHRLEASTVSLDESTDAKAILESVRQRIRIEAPGECPCSMISPSLDGIAVEAQLPADAPETLNALAADDARVIFGASPSGVFFRDLSTTSSGAWWKDAEATPAPEFGVTLAGGAYLASYYDSELEENGFNKLRKYVPQGDGSFSATTIELPDYFRVNGLERSPTDPEGRVYIYGRYKTAIDTRGRALECDATATLCSDLQLDCRLITMNNFNIADDGRLYIVDTGRLAVRNPGAMSALCIDLPQSLPPLGEPLLLGEVEQYGDRLFVCATIGPVAKLFSLPVTDLLPMTVLDPGVLIPAPGGYECASIFVGLTPAEPVLIQVREVSGYRLYAFAADGTALGSSLVTDRFGPGAVRLEDLGGHRIAVRGSGNTLSLVGPGGALEAIYGATRTSRLPDYDVGLPLPDGRSLLVGTPAAALLVDKGTTQAFSAEPPIRTATPYLMATVDTRASISSGAPAFIANEVDVDGTERFVRRTLKSDGTLVAQPLPWSTNEMIAIAESAPDRFLLVKSDGIWLHSSAEREPLAQIAGRELIMSVLPSRNYKPTAVAGVVWLRVTTGLLRIAGGTADAYAVPGSGGGPPSLLCPDDVVIVSRLDGLNGLVRLGPDPSGPSTDFLPLVDVGPERPAKASVELWTLRDGVGFAWFELRSGTLVKQGPTPVFGLGYRPELILQTADGLVFGGDHGRVAIAR